MVFLLQTQADLHNLKVDKVLSANIIFFANKRDDGSWKIEDVGD